MRFYYDSDIKIPIRWYWCEDGAKRLPFYTRFGSGNWASDKFRDWNGPGEVKGAKRTYDEGANTSGKTGQRLCGNADQYANGVSVNDTLTPCSCGQQGVQIPLEIDFQLTELDPWEFAFDFQLTRNP